MFPSRRTCLTLASALLAWPSFGQAAGREGGCQRVAGERVAFSPSGDIEVFRNANFDNKEFWLACWRPTGAVRRIATVPVGEDGRPTRSVDGFNFRGGWVVWAEISSDPSGAASMRSANVRTGAPGTVVNSTMNAAAGRTDGPVQSTEPPASRLVAVAYSGRFAWVVVTARTPDGRLVDAVYVADGEGGSVRADAGRPGSIRRFGSRGNRAVWTRAGRQRSISLK